MSDLDQYGPNKPCKRTACEGASAHLGGAHTDPRSDLYDGPGTALQILPLSCRDAAQTLHHTARKQGWDERLVDTALGLLAREILNMKDHVAAAWVDRDRGINAAMKRAEDCTQHGADIRHESHQAYWFSRQADSENEQRLAWVSACHEIEHVLTNARKGLVDPEVTAWVKKRIAAAGAAQSRIRKRYEGPTHADCDKAGKCEHPAPQPHGACEQLRLNFDAPGEIAA